MNMLEAVVVREQGSTRLVAGEISLELSERTLAAHAGLPAYEGRAIVLGIRPEALGDAELSGDGDQPRLRGRAELRAKRSALRC